jgi:hypothetical protein
MEAELDGLDSSYNNIKFLNQIHYTNYLNLVSLYSTNNHNLSYTQVLNSFQANYAENLITTDEYLDVKSTVSDQLCTSSDYELRLSNPIKLRSTAKNSIVTFNALQKVFRPRFDEGRSNVRFQELSNTFVKYPYLSEARVPYESLLGKNKESFFTANVYKTTLTTDYSSFSPIINSLNTYFSNLPFLTSMQSDAVRFLWFD